ncbi:hypothetical protein ACHAW5_007964 [Stephanodiscus triporus]|uniref:Fe2OG dioxygenase domain-containing protein n=1 Tax=Stephanodiscus triporus TaxID=2934178 RepID=A0ABD3MWK2_9STRA
MASKRAILSSILLLGARGIVSFAFETPRRSTARRRHRHRRHRATFQSSTSAPGERSQSSSTSAGGGGASVVVVPPPGEEEGSSPSLSQSAIEDLSTRGYAVVPGFLPRSFVDDLRRDAIALRSDSMFRRAGIGQDSSNALDEGVRVAETCFLGRGRRELSSSTSISSISSISSSSYAGGSGCVRDGPGGLHDVLDGLRESLDSLDPNAPRLDRNLDEVLYAYYPRGGYYRRHRDAVPNSASVLRRYSLLLYLNGEGYDPDVDGGRLRIHLDGGGDECPPGEEPKFVDVDPIGGTLVLFRSDAIPHEVLDTNAERYAVVGWYNRGVSPADIGTLGGAVGGGTNVARAAMLAVGMALVTFGVASILGQ